MDRQAVVRVKRRLRRSAFAYVAAIFVYIVVTALADTGTVFSDMPGAVQREVVPWLYGLRYTALLFMNLLPLGCLYDNFDMYVALRLARRVTIVATILQMMVILVIVCVVLACADCDPSLYDPVFRWHDLTLLFTWFVTVLCTMFADAMLLHSVMFNIVQGVFVIARRMSFAVTDLGVSSRSSASAEVPLGSVSPTASADQISYWTYRG